MRFDVFFWERRPFLLFRSARVTLTALSVKSKLRAFEVCKCVNGSELSAPGIATLLAYVKVWCEELMGQLVTDALLLCVCVWGVGLIVLESPGVGINTVFQGLPVCVSARSCVRCCREQSGATGLKLCCYSSNELPGASAFLMKSSLWSLLYLIPVGQVPSSLPPISTAAI